MRAQPVSTPPRGKIPTLDLVLHTSVNRRMSLVFYVLLCCGVAGDQAAVLSLDWET